MIRYLGSFWSGRGDTESKPDPYGEDLLYANWNPAVGAIVAAGSTSMDQSGPELPADLTEAEVDDFLSRIYALAAQI